MDHLNKIVHKHLIHPHLHQTYDNRISYDIQLFWVQMVDLLNELYVLVIVDKNLQSEHIDLLNNQLYDHDLATNTNELLFFF